MTPADLQLCVDLGLAERVREGVYVLTGAGRILAGIPPQRRVEAFSSWWERQRQATATTEPPATRARTTVCECGRAYPEPHKPNCRWRRVPR